MSTAEAAARQVEHTHAERGPHPRTRSAGRLATGPVLALVAVLVVGCDDGPRAQRPTAAVTTPAPSPTTSAPPAWVPPGPVRPSTARLVTTKMDQYGEPTTWSDPRDTSSPGIDILTVREGQDFQGGSSWAFQLAARTPRDPVGRVIAYGITVDGDGDHRADCQIGIDNDAPDDGDFHVWVTNLRTHESALRDGPPYGAPVEFAHPAEGGTEGYAPEIQFGFLTGLTHPGPCDAFGRSPTFYAWSSVTVAGKVVETDYAPDAAWLPVHCAACGRS